jgi:SAM-dependent methyltransferase
MQKERPADQQDRTMADFGDQWGRYTDNSGFYGSVDLLQDMFAPLLEPRDIEDRCIADIGSGTGRIVQMLMVAGARHVTAIEPSDAFGILEANTRPYGERVRCLKLRGDQIPEEGFDLVVSVGVLHHIPEPSKVMAAAWRALRPGGRMAAWVYGYEGNEAYLAFARPLRAITTHLPHAILAGLSWLLTAGLALYLAACRILPLPLGRYMTSVISRLTWEKRYLTVYDQLNPTYARYYRREEALNLFESNGFTDVRLHHRHGYSWAIVGSRPPRGISPAGEPLT